MPHNPERLAQARALAATLSDDGLARELRGDVSALEPEAAQALKDEAARRAAPRVTPILTTAPTLNLPIRRILGIVGAEYVMSVSPTQELVAGIRDTDGIRSVYMQEALKRARLAVMKELTADAQDLRADAVVSVSLSVSDWRGQQKSMLIVHASGTAVELETIPTER